jgi:hypothetical protein
MRHAVEAHGLRMHDCPLGCTYGRARRSCEGCRGAGFVFTFVNPERCGPDCLIEGRAQ